MAIARIRFSPRGTVTPPPPDPSGTLLLTGTAREGQSITVTNTTGYPCFTQVLLPGTESYDQAWLDLDLNNPEPALLLTYAHVGFKVRVRALVLDSNGLPTGQQIVSNEIGPVLHAVDPWTLPGAETVSNATALRAAMDAGTPVIVLAAGTTWASTDFRNTYSNGRITTDPANPARIVNSYMAPSNWDNVVYDAMVHYFSADYLINNARPYALQFGGGNANPIVRSLKIYAENIPASVYQDVPADLTRSIYRNSNLDNPGTSGMRFTVFGLNVVNTTNARVEGFWTRNVAIGIALAPDTVADHVRVHGHYGDSGVLQGNAANPGNGSLTNYYASHNYGLYDERDATGNKFGLGNSPHSEFQSQGGTTNDYTIDRFCILVGNTRAQGDGCTAEANPVNPNFASSGQVNRMRFRRALFGGSGAISTYCYQKDYLIDYLTQVGMGLRAGGASGSLRFNGNGITDEGRYDDEGLVSRSIMAGNVTTAFLDPSAFITQDDAVVNAGSGIGTYIQGDLTVRPDTLAEFALRARPRAAHADKGALTTSGHWRTLGAIPASPSVTLTGGTGTFSASFAPVSGAEVYRIRYRVNGAGGAWTVDPLPPYGSPSTSIVASGLSAGTYEVQATVRTPDGWSRWGTLQTVVVS